MQRANVYRLEPTETQAIAFGQWVGACRFVYNLALDQRPSLRPFAASVLVTAFAHGRDDTERETGLLHLPTDCPWTLDQVLDPAFLPDDPGA